MDTHRPDPLSLVSGTIFLVIGIIATAGSLTWTDLRGQWVGPVLLGAAGLALLASVPVLRRDKTRDVAVEESDLGRQDANEGPARHG